MTDYSALVAALRDHTGWAWHKTLIDAAEAIEDLSKRLDESIPKGDAEIIIAELAKPRWIPVTERLPDSGQSCLCYYNGGQFGELSWISLDKYIDCDGCSGFYPFHKDEPIGAVTHWMSLPKPPKEEV